jgi:hypothetical protein
MPGFATVLTFIGFYQDFENVGFHVYIASRRFQSLNQTDIHYLTFGSTNFEPERTFPHE